MKVIFVCLGNICRSPMAESMFRQMVIDAELADKVHGIYVAAAGKEDHWIVDP